MPAFFHSEPPYLSKLDKSERRFVPHPPLYYLFGYRFVLHQCIINMLSTKSCCVSRTLGRILAKPVLIVIIVVDLDVDS